VKRPPCLRLGERGDAAGSDAREREREHEDRDPPDRERDLELPEVVADPSFREGEVELRVAIRRGAADDQRRNAADVDPLERELPARGEVTQAGRDPDADRGIGAVGATVNEQHGVDPPLHVVALNRLREIGRFGEERIGQSQVEHGLGPGPLEGIAQAGIPDQHEDRRRERGTHSRRNEHDDNGQPARRPPTAGHERQPRSSR
jgi:hypothetical protein